MNQKLMVTPKEAAEMLGLDISVIYALARGGELERRFVGEGTTRYRIPVESLRAYMHRLPTEPIPAD